MARSSPRWLVAGRVGRPHGLDGSFHVTRPRATLLAEGMALWVGDASRRLERCAGTPERPIVRVSGCASRSDAEALRGTDLLVARADAPELGEDEWYAEDLEGCAVVDRDRSVGTVRRLVPLPSCEALEVERGGREPLLVPLVRDAVRSVDVEAGVVDVDLVYLGEEA